MDTPRCFHSHMGLWVMAPDYLLPMSNMIKSGTFAESEPVAMRAGPLWSAADVVETADGGVYLKHQNGIASVSLTGTMMKGASKFGGTSTVAARQAIRAAMNDKAVKGILLSIDSPGGHVAGTDELAQDVARAASVKPVFTHVNDLMASAALWVGVQANSVSVNRAGDVGSIGVVAVVHDTSGLAERDGVKVHVVSTGPMKGAGTPGTPITDEMLGSIQLKVDAINELFVSSVATGRGMSEDEVRKLATGEVFGAQEALANGLVDYVRSLEETAQALLDVVQASSDANSRRRRAAIAKANLI